MNALTNTGERYALYGNGSSNGAIARLATKLKLYSSVSVPIKDGIEGTDFIEISGGNGYTTGGLTISVADWTFSVVSGKGRIVLGDKSWTATGGSIANIAGAYITDASDNVLAWWERPTGSATSGTLITMSGLYVG